MSAGAGFDRGQGRIREVRENRSRGTRVVGGVQRTRVVFPAQKRYSSRGRNVLSGSPSGDPMAAYGTGVRTRMREGAEEEEMTAIQERMARTKKALQLQWQDKLPTKDEESLKANESAMEQEAIDRR